jgi:hypothetical protein
VIKLGAALIMLFPAAVGMCQGAKAPNVTPPQRLDVFMKPGPHWKEQCDDMGGVSMSFEVDGKTVRLCKDVDY